jgi:hypothetical protein
MTDEQLKADLRRRHPEADDGFEVRDFVWRYGSALDALMYAHLFWPAFFLEKGMIFTAHAVKDHGALENIQLPVSDPTETEKSFNLVELPYDLFNDLEMTDEQFDGLVETLREMWTARLQALYPGQKFIVEVSPLDPSDPESDLGLTVYKDRS